MCKSVRNSCSCNFGRFCDWELNARPFFYLAFTALAVQDDRVRNLCVAAAVVGVAGIGVALIASIVGPAALLVQGQAWRCIWIPAFVALLLLAPTALRTWQDDRCGPLCVILLVSGWTLSAVDGTACVSVALLLWIMRPYIDARIAKYCRWLAAALFIAVVAWILAQSWRIVASAGAAAHASTGNFRTQDLGCDRRHAPVALVAGQAQRLGAVVSHRRATGFIAIPCAGRVQAIFYTGRRRGYRRIL